MPFMGKDWRAPGETWIRVHHTAGWEQIKLRPIQLSSSLDSSSSSASVLDLQSRFKRHSSSASLCSNGDDGTSSSTTGSVTRSDSDESVYEDDDWIPHCFVKTTRSKEFIGCTSMSEAFHRLDIARAVVDVRRFNYICKVVQILVEEKLRNLSATARRHLFAIIQAIVMHSVDQDVHVSTARDLVNRFGTGLEGHVYGSPQIVTRQLDTVSSLLDMISDRQPKPLHDSSEDSVTFLDLPREVIVQVLRKLPDHTSLLEAAKAHEALDALVERESRMWEKLNQFHFTQEQINKHRTESLTGRKLFFQLKKYYGLKEHYADLIHICCHCKALFWKDHGHPCVGTDAPSVRVTPQQFVDMLLFL
uniref:F-box domain-containing protein n=1 Tax=Panagrellus redivivus TaxID=6233 RepID=A0A7E4UPF6_PANRE